MADLNALIAQGAQFRQAPDPFVQYGQMQQLEQNQQTNALNQMKMQEAQATMAERNALRQLNPSAADYESQLFKVNPTLGIAYRKEASAAGASKAAQQLSEAKTIETKQQILGQAYRDLSNRPDDEHIVTYGRDVQGSTLFSDAEKATVAARVTQLLKMPVEERKALLASQGAKSSELNRPPVILGPGQIAIPGNDPRLTGTGVTAPAAALAPQALPASVQEYEYAKTVPGGGFVGTYQDFVKAKADAARGPAPIAAPQAQPPSVLEYNFAKTPDGGNFVGTYQDFVKAKAEAGRAPDPVAAPPSMVAEYTFAKTPEGGNFRGTYQQFVTARAVAGRAPAPPRAEAAPSITTIIDPTDSSKMITVDARRYTGGGVGSPGVIGVGGKEPGAALRVDKAQAGKTQLADDLYNLRASFTRLDELRAIPSTERNVVSNLMSAAGSSGIGQTFGRAGGSSEQVERDVINSARQRLISSIKNATGMSARSLDSNVELKTMLNSISDPSQSFQAAMRIIDDIENAYVKGDGMLPKPGQQVPQSAIDALKSGKGTDAQFDEIFGAGAAKRARGGK